jgi:hypothetical protein
LKHPRAVIDAHPITVVHRMFTRIVRHLEKQ